MTEELFGVPTQSLMDGLLLLINDHGNPEENGAIEVDHCKGIIYLAADKVDVDGEWVGGMPCYPVDPNKYPNWRCGARDQYGTDDNYNNMYHAHCLKLNDPTFKSASMCSCPAQKRVQEGDYSIPANYFAGNNAYCPYCGNSHSMKPEPCPVCGDVHE